MSVSCMTHAVISATEVFTNHSMVLPDGHEIITDIAGKYDVVHDVTTDSEDLSLSLSLSLPLSLSMSVVYRAAVIRLLRVKN